MSQKQIIFLIITSLGCIIFGLFFWFSAKETLFSPGLETTLKAAALAVLWLSLVCLSLIFTHGYLIRAGLSLINGSLLLFPWSFGDFSLAAAGLLTLSLFVLSLGLSQRQKANPKTSAGSLLPPLKTTLSLLSISLTILFYPKSQEEASTFKINIPDQIFNSLIQNFGLGGDQRPLSDDFLQSQFEKQVPLLRQQLSDQGVNDPELVNRQIDQSRRQFLAQAQVSRLDPSADTQSIKKMAEGQLDSILAQYRQYLPILLIVSFYLTLSFFTGPVYLLVLLLVQIYLWILKFTGLASIRKETVAVERLVLD